MSTVAAREPARAGDVARHYLRLLGSGRGVVVLLPVVVVGAVLSGESFHGFGGLPLILWLMAGLPFVQWGIAERSGALDEAMPLDTVRHGLVRVACGTLWAATALAPAIGFLALRWYPGSAGIGAAALGLYPVLLLAAGLTYHLLGAAAWLCGSRRGAALGAIAFLALVPLLASRSFLARGERLLALRETPAPGELLAWTSAQALWTAAALAAVWLAATAPRLEARAGGGRRGAARAWIGRRRGVLPQRRVRAGALRRPAPLHRVLWREIVIVRLSMAGMGAALLLVTLWINPMLDAAAANPASSPWFGAIYSFSIAWSIAVWLPFAVSGRRVVDP
ncbi:MAG TPA: hypothetical protein VGO40_01040, partial [Longimicrobium sp.]|nr:hypothetical protein [Longimicrobium sp.]